MFSHSDNLNPWIKCHGSNTLIYISDKEHVVFLSFLWTYNFSCQIKQSQGDMRLEIYYYLEYRRFSSFPILQQTNKTLVSLLSFKVDLMQKNIILSLAIETDRYGKMLFSKQEVKKYAGAVNYTAVSYRSWTVKWGAICPHARYWQIAHNVSTINFFSLLINYLSFLLNIQHPLNNR